MKSDRPITAWRLPPKPRALATLCCILLLVQGCVKLPEHLTLSLGPHRLQVEVAATAEARTQGLMGRTSLAADSGMLLVYPDEVRPCIWMFNTHIALSVAFLDAQGRIVNTVDAAPRSTVIHCASAPAKYALEVNRDWYAERGIAAGDRFDGLDSLNRPYYRLPD